jgi:protein tyrosine phosphatase (PTP) superfamily phosphohydrolase (DUF442 family)
MQRFTLVVTGLLALSGGGLFLTSAASAGDPPAPPPAGAPAAPAAPAAPDDTEAKKCIHNFFHLSKKIMSGAQPESEKDFAALAAAGVKVILSVDGSVPDLENAHKYGMRYVHLPIGYDGIDEDTTLKIAQMFSSLDGPFFVHCHLGKHRGPAACAIGRILLDGITPTQAIGEMKRAGTGQQYKGLYAVPQEFRVPPKDKLKVAPSDLPEVTYAKGITAAMVQTDRIWTRIKIVHDAKWSVPKDHPDLDPAHEALMLTENFREIRRMLDTTKPDPGFVEKLADTEKYSGDLLKSLQKEKLDLKGAENAYDRIGKSCTSCHVAFRDNVNPIREPNGSGAAGGDGLGGAK